MFGINTAQRFPVWVVREIRQLCMEVFKWIGLVGVASTAMLALKVMDGSGNFCQFSLTFCDHRIEQK